MSGRRTRRVRVVTYDAGARTERPDTLAVEEPLEIRVGGAAYTTTMRTPGHDIELAHGLLAAEGVIDAAADVATMRYCAGSVVTGPDATPQNTYNVLDVALAWGEPVPPERRRASLTTSACGVCGTAAIELLRRRPRHDLAADATSVDVATLVALPARFGAEQPAFAATGGLHAAGLFTAAGEPIVVREDVGRHNAVDKVLGWALLNGRRPASGTILLVSGRTSFELAQKAVLAGVPVLAGISAPSSLAVELADDLGLTLVGFVRGERLNVYTHPGRVRG